MGGAAPRTLWALVGSLPVPKGRGWAPSLASQLTPVPPIPRPAWNEEPLTLRFNVSGLTS